MVRLTIFLDGGIDMIYRSIKESCIDITRLFQFQLTTTYLAVSKQKTSQQFVEKLKSAAVSFKRTKQFYTMIDAG
jgi:hypothetical protein